MQIDQKPRSTFARRISAFEFDLILEPDCCRTLIESTGKMILQKDRHLAPTSVVLERQTSLIFQPLDSDCCFNKYPPVDRRTSA